MKTIMVKAERRQASGKEIARKLRAQGHIPAVFYGYGIEPVKLSINSAELLKQLGKEKAEGTFVKLMIGDEAGSNGEKLSIIKDLQVDAMKRALVHADFYEIKMDREVTVDLAVSVTGDAIGIENGGELQVLKREVKVSGLPGVLPEVIDVDVSNLDIGDTIKVGDLVFQEGITVQDQEDVAIITVAITRATLAAGKEEEGAEEGEASEAQGATASEEE